MVTDLAAFVASFNMELEYPCSHRRMKRYITEDGVDNFRRYPVTLSLYCDINDRNLLIMNIDSR